MQQCKLTMAMLSLLKQYKLTMGILPLLKKGIQSIVHGLGELIGVSLRAV